jgi:MFS family permease
MKLATAQQENTSVWLALKNRIFIGLWIASLVSGFCVSAHDTAATWLMNSLGASPFLLSLMATSASLPFFLFTLPSGAISDLVNRQNLFIATYLWLAATAGLLAVCTWLRLVNPYFILTTVFLLGIGFAFNAPVLAAIVPEVVRKEELASAITLGGVQMNLGGIVGPALAALLLPIAGPAMLFSLNALAFLFAAWMIARRPISHLVPLLEFNLDRAKRWKFAWQQSPLAASPQEVKERMARRLVVRGRPPGRAAGRTGATQAHAASVRSVS